MAGANGTRGRARERHVVVISREWNNPAIQISVTDARIAIAMKLPAFLTALAAELGDEQLTEARLAKAAEIVCQKMKNETSKVM